MGSAHDILSRGPAGIGDYEDQTITILAAEFGTSQAYGENVALTLKDEDGNEDTVTTGAVAVLRKVRDLKTEGHLPVKVKVVSYPGQFGKPGYDLTPPDDVLGVA